MNDTIDLLQVKIEKARAQLPEETRHAIDSVDWRQVILAMRTSKGYTIEQLGDLELETELLLCGLITTDNYARELGSRLRLSKIQVETLVNDMNTLVFKKIKSELMRLMSKSKMDGSEKITEQVVVENITTTPNHEVIFRKAGIEIVPPSTTPAVAKPIMTKPAKEPEIQKVVVTDITKTLELEAPDVPLEIEAPKEEEKKTEVATNSPKTIKAPIKVVEPTIERKTDSIVMQKLSGSIQMPKKTTEYSTTPTVSNTTNPTPKPKIDPYRMPIE